VNKRRFGEHQFIAPGRWRRVNGTGSSSDPSPAGPAQRARPMSHRTVNSSSASGKYPWERLKLIGCRGNRRAVMPPQNRNRQPPVYRDQPPQCRPARRMFSQELKGGRNEHRQRIQCNQPRLIRRRPMMILDRVVKAVTGPILEPRPPIKITGKGRPSPPTKRASSSMEPPRLLF